MEKNFDAQSAESRILNEWLDQNAFAAGANHKDGMPSYTIMIPPPNVTGALHLGHAFNNTLQDILVRWHRMRGYDVLWQPGQDHAGIATQLQVEKQLAERGLKRTDMSREEFLAEVWKWKGEKGDTIISQLKRLGASCDWSRNAFTMAGAAGDPGAGHENSANFHDAVLKVFVDLYEKGLIYRGKRLVNWDPHFETAISDLEVENKEVDGHMWHFKYPLADGVTYTYIEKDDEGKVVLQEERDYISIATTRPETMLGDGAVAVHPSDERYQPLIGKYCIIPVGPKALRRQIPIIADEYPDPNFGSGAVKITGAHDFNDYQVAKRNKILMFRLMDGQAKMRDDGEDYQSSVAKAAKFQGAESVDEKAIDALNLVPDDYRGLDRFDARAKVIAEIDADGLMITVEDKPIMQPFGDRSKTVIEPMLTDQWFVDAETLAGPALEAVRSGRIRIIPESGEKTYYHWLENIEPWCISRQLWWGHQVPVWYDDEGNQYCAMSEDEAIAQSGGKSLTRDSDVMDTWFSSGLWPFGTLGWPEKTPELAKYFPGNDLITGQDILFFWVARMIMMSLEVTGEIPFDTVYLHGLVRDENGVKMSKTLGNVIDPLDLIEEFGADATRFTMAAMAGIGSTLKLSRNRIVGYRNFGTKIWNAARFAQMHEAYDIEEFDPLKAEAKVNRWIIGEVAKAQAATDKALGEYRFNDAANGLYAFVWHKLCDWYVEFSKPLLFDEKESALRNETRGTLAWAIDQAITMLHPIMPYITEEIWANTAKREVMLVHQDWPQLGDKYIDADADWEMNWVIDLIERVRSVRSELRVPAGAKVNLLQIQLDENVQAAFLRNQALVEKLARIGEFTISPDVPKGAVSIPVEGGVFALPLADVINFADEIERLNRQIEKLQKEAQGINGRLNNAKFVESAPAAVVEDARARSEELQIEIEKLQEAHQRVSDLL